MNTALNPIDDFSEQLFWDVAREAVSLETHASFLLQRILEHGTLDDWKRIKSLLGEAKIRRLAVDLRTLDDFSLSFLSTVLGIPKKEFRCYTEKPSPATFWSY